MPRSVTLVVALLIAGCAPDVSASRAAVNGAVDSAEAFGGVLGMRIDKPEGVASCTGVLVAPNLVLTARHCVSSTQPAIVCGASPFSDPVAGANVLSTNDVTVEASSLAVRASRVEVPPEGNDECGFDIAAVILLAEVPGGVVYPPRLDEPPRTGERFTAVGYGTDGSGGLGTRRVAEDVSVACVGGVDCTIDAVQATELVAADGFFCRSDSGAPAIDEAGRVIGVVSKGINPCSTPILTSTYAFREWLGTVGRMAAEAGGYPVPAWATPAPTPDAGPADRGASDGAVAPDASASSDAGTGGSSGGCAARPATARGRGGSAWWALLALGLWRPRRRRRPATLKQRPRLR